MARKEGRLARPLQTKFASDGGRSLASQWRYNVRLIRRNNEGGFQASLSIYQAFRSSIIISYFLRCCIVSRPAFAEPDLMRQPATEPTTDHVPIRVGYEGDNGQWIRPAKITPAPVTARLIRSEPRIHRHTGVRRTYPPLTAALTSMPGVRSVRGRGLLLAAELDGVDTRQAYTALLARGLVVNTVTPTALRFAPPLNVSDDHIDEAMAMVAEVLA